MTLEKLLIFGFALAVVSALTTMATGVADSRGEMRDGYKERVGDVVEKAR